MKQTEKIFMISDAAKQVQVEAHVLRYWEEELKLQTKRNEMGHRYYTEEDIKKFCQIKEWKEQGLQLKAIRNIMKNGVYPNDFEEYGKRHVMMVKKGEILPVHEESREQKSLRLQQLLQHMIAETLKNNNEELCNEIKESLLKELDYQFRLQDEKEDIREEERTIRQEEHYKQVDELIRNCNKKDRGNRRVSLLNLVRKK